MKIAAGYKRKMMENRFRGENMERKFKEDLNHIENGILLLDSIEDINQVYHYTTAGGLKDILEEKNFKITHSNFLKDNSNIKYTYEIIIDTLTDMINRENNHSVVRMLDLIKSDISLVRDREVGPGNIKVRSREGRPSEFVLTFSLNKDAMTVWSKYAGEGSYNAGFTLSELLYIFEQFTEFPYIPGKVIYDVEKQKSIIELKTLQFLEVYLKHSHHFTPEMLNLFLIRYTSSVRLYSNFFKNPAFYSDEEFRIIFYNYRHLNYVVPDYHIRDNIFLPTVETFSKKLNNFHFPLESITVGPSFYQEMAKESLSYLLVDLGFDLDSISLLSSEIPFSF